MIFDLLIIVCLFLIVLTLIYLIIKTNQIQRLIKTTSFRLESTIHHETTNQFNQFESYTYLRDRLNLHNGLPYTTHWSASPDFLKIIVEHCLNCKPTTILECSSGLTTVMLARCCQINNTGHVFSLEHDSEYVTKSQANIKRYELDNFTTIINAPLKTYNLNSTEYQWYAIDNIPDSKINMLVIDGPPGYIQKHSRYPALSLLLNRLADDCIIFLDDADRNDEKELIEMWKNEHPSIKHHYINTERGCSILLLN